MGTVKFGIVGLDGHGPHFARYVNGAESEIEGARVVAAMPVPSVMVSEEELAKNVETTRALGVEIVHEPEALAAQADGILILYDDGSRHLELVRRFADFGKPLFVDKPLEATAQKARDLVALCRSSGAAVFSSSALRFTPEIRRAIEGADAGPIISAMTYSPFTQKPTMPGWIYYGIHAVEPLYALMGAGCQELRCIPSDLGPVAVGRWEGGRVGIAKAVVRSVHGYGFVAWREKTTDAATIAFSGIYLGLLKNIKKFVESGQSPVDPAESVEVIAFMEAANESMARGGETVLVERA